ncbi:uncharacterized protein LOC124358680 [Homalodisca vitripennis]|uniref:uncharacterized protein LOC124358680 n=1 Tax=Homalodisca vitripennis TaxID=197043 RepID=UPI001EE9C45A|nr:uncharacterized protein LOC124358680 [Homalodisca vitripennis]
MFYRLIVFLAAGEWNLVTAGIADPDVSELSLLPLDRLLLVKRNLKPSPSEIPAADLNDSTRPGALPLRGDPAFLRPTEPSRRGGGPPIWVEEVVDTSWKGGGGYSHGGGGYSHGGKGKGGLEAIFQGTVTTLAFLAFGGYLLCLVLHMLKEKKAALTMTLLTTTAPAVTRRRRDATPVSASKPDEMYRALRHLAEGYAKYNQHCLDHS